MPVPQLPRFTLPTIEERYAKGPPTRDAADRRSRLSSEEREYILFRSLRGLSAARIARELGVGAATVRDARRDIARCPSLLLGLRLFELAKISNGKSSRRSWWKCLLCGAVDTGGRRRALQHLLDTVYPPIPFWRRNVNLLSADEAGTYLFMRRAPRRLQENPLWSVSEELIEQYLGPRSDGLPWTTTQRT